MELRLVDCSDVGDGEKIGEVERDSSSCASSSCSHVEHIHCAVIEERESGVERKGREVDKGCILCQTDGYFRLRRQC